jgi:ABC-type uncharacterized transport system permease subunit
MLKNRLKGLAFSPLLVVIKEDTMSPLLSDLTVITIWTAVPMVIMTTLIRVVWRHGKHVEEP